MNSLNVIKNALLGVTDKVFHYQADGKACDKYIVWAEDGEGSAFKADNIRQDCSLTGTVKYFTKTEYDENVEKIQKALNTADVSFFLIAVEYNRETKFIEYTWEFEVV